MDYTVSTDASGNEVTEFETHDSCGQFVECHAEPPTCGCGLPLDCDFPEDVDEHGNLLHSECACPTDLVEKERRLRDRAEEAGY